MPTTLPTCERCLTRPAASNLLSVLGPLDTREQWFCRACAAALVAEDAHEALPAEGDVSWLGPLNFAVLRASIRRSEADPRIPGEQFAAVAADLLRIAAAHGQALPEDVAAFVARHTHGRAGT